MLVLAMFHENEELTNILSFDKQFLVQLGFELLATLILVFVLAKLLYQPVRKFLENRKERIAKELADAEAARAAALKSQEDYAAHLSNIDAERQSILEEAHRRAHEQEALIIKNAREQAEQLVSRAHAEIEREREKAADEMKRQMIELSVLVSQRYIAKAIDTAEQNKLLDEVISGLGDMTWSA